MYSSLEETVGIYYATEGLCILKHTKSLLTKTCKYIKW